MIQIPVLFSLAPIRWPLGVNPPHWVACRGVLYSNPHRESPVTRWFSHNPQRNGESMWLLKNLMLHIERLPTFGPPSRSDESRVSRVLGLYRAFEMMSGMLAAPDSTLQCTP